MQNFLLMIRFTIWLIKSFLVKNVLRLGILKNIAPRSWLFGMFSGGHSRRDCERISLEQGLLWQQKISSVSFGSNTGIEVAASQFSTEAREIPCSPDIGVTSIHCTSSPKTPPDSPPATPPPHLRLRRHKFSRPWRSLLLTLTATSLLVTILLMVVEIDFLKPSHSSIPHCSSP